ncbi:LemA family protein [Sphingomonas sp.]|uniref:LemA family protein n=1 Tax=Sphingomonas sp. TaxID=28214 RepID=UPI0035C80262
MSIIILLALVGLGVFAIKTYNRLRLSSEEVKQARADITATVKKRVDIAQRLSDIASQYGEHEKLSHFTLGELANDGSPARTDGAIGHMVSEIRTLATHYPDLKANQAYQKLMGQLDAIEDQILAARSRYNQAVKTYNTERSEFPQVLIASHIGFPEAPYFEVNDDGMDRLASFVTDDGTMLREGMGRIANRLGNARPATAAAAQTGVRQPTLTATPTRPQ